MPITNISVVLIRILVVYQFPNYLQVRARIIDLSFYKPLSLVDESICLNNGNGLLPLNYNGHIARSASGKICKNWAEITEPVHALPADRAGSRNYCRATNVSGSNTDKGAWCYVSNIKTEYCTCNTGTCSNNVNGNLPVGYQDQN